MSAPTSCCTTCDTPTTTQIPGPQGDPGTNGTNGADGVNAFTLTTADFDVPLVGANVTVNVADSAWMADGQVIFVEGAGYFNVASKPTSTSVILTYLDYEVNTNAGNTISTGAAVSPGGTQPSAPTNADEISTFGAGTAYQLTTTPGAVTLGTTSPAMTISQAGSWALFYFARVDFVGATYSAVKEATFKLRRTNNTAADVTNSAHTFIMPIVTTVDHTAGLLTIGPIPYVTANADDAIALYGSIEADPDAGEIDVTDAYVAALYVNATTS